MGSKAERATHLLLGGLPCEERDSAQLQQDLEQIAHKLEEEEGKSPSPGREAKLAKLRLNQYITQAKLQKTHQELEGMPALARDREGNPVRAICGTVYPGTKVTIGGQFLVVDQLRENCAIGLVGGEVGFCESSKGGGRD